MRTEQIPTLHTCLQAQAEAEYRHAYLLCQHAGLKLPQQPQALQHGHPEWGTVEGIQADGISQRYLAARIFFHGRKASEYPLSEQLAFMTVLEGFQSVFYEELAKISTGKLGQTIRAIAQEERDHAQSLEACLKAWEQHSITGLLLKWQIRKYLALLLLPFSHAT